jgi:hypothetical protein
MATASKEGVNYSIPRHGGEVLLINDRVRAFSGVITGISINYRILLMEEY